MPEMPLQEERVWIPHGKFMLEGRLVLGRALAGVVCHPHPGYGGDMENNVVMAACRGLAAAGVSVLRFNFRDAGPSPEVMAEGESEIQEVRAAVEFLRDRTGSDASDLVLAGYSFGAWVGLRALMEMEPILGWVAIAPPLGIWDFSFAKLIAGRKLLLAGNQDQFCPLALLENFFESLEEPKEIKILDGVDHFLWGLDSRLTHIVKEATLSWVKEFLD